MMSTLSPFIAWQTDYPTALALARAAKRMVLVYFHKPN